MDTCLTDWIGREEHADELIAAAPIAGWLAVLDHEPAMPRDGDAAPPLTHWLYFQPRARHSGLGEDGHPQRGGFLPPVPLPRRMWAGSRIEFLRPLRVGRRAERRSRIAEVRQTEGRHGPLVFVTVRHEVHDDEGLVLVDEHDIVYRGAAAPGSALPAPAAAPRDEGFARRVVPDVVLLFRYSALTFNGHRIHYDRPYATEVEGYPGLVVHGPLIATLLLDLLGRERPAMRVRRFEFRALAPLFDGRPFELCGRDEAPGRVGLWARDERGALAMTASAQTE